ncbi:hypothetical protein N7527_004683 [Penicillium freii]|nr:hypothetical protein N7527_004683 [Penicillium freii]
MVTSLPLLLKALQNHKYALNTTYGLPMNRSGGLIARSNLLRCDPIVFRNAPIKLGLYPFCLGAKGKKPAKRILQFHSYIEDHLKELKLDFDCKHLAYTTHFESLEELTYHLVDMYC